MLKLTLLDDWLKAIDELIRAYSKGFDSSDLDDCPLCRVSSVEGTKQGESKRGGCYCPWYVFDAWGKGEKGSCYTIALLQTQEERINRLKDWRKRILRMKKRRKK